MISSSTTNPITGLSPTFASTTAVEGGTNLFFEPIPREMLYTSVTKPQVKLTIDGIEAACANVNCDYEYTTSLASVTGQALSGLDLTIDGTNLPISSQTVIFGGAACGTVTGTSSQLTCTLSHEPYGGSHEVELYDTDGRIPNSGLTPIVVTTTVTSISPSTGIN